MYLFMILFAMAVEGVEPRPATNPAPDGPIIEGNPLIQEHLERLAQTKKRSVEQVQALNEISRLARDQRLDRKYVILQAALYDAKHPRMHTLLALSPQMQAEGVPTTVWLLPYYDSGDADLRQFVRQWAAFDADPRYGMTTDPRTRAVCNYVSTRRHDAPAGLVRNLFFSAPATAVIELSRSWLSADQEKLRSVFWAEHVIEDIAWKHGNGFLRPNEELTAETELDKLSKFDEWWVRLYAAHMLWRHDDLFDAPAVRQRLQQDSNPLVVEAVNTINPHGMTEEEERAAWQRLGHPEGRPSTAPLKRLLEE